MPRSRAGYSVRSRPSRRAPQSLIVTVWGDALAPHGGTVWLAGLIRLMAPFGINERLVRTSVFRLARDGWLDAATHGRVSRYRLTREGKRRFDDAHQRIYARPDDDWHGDWDVVLADAVPPARRTALREELVWAGLRRARARPSSCAPRRVHARCRARWTHRAWRSTC